MRVRLEVDGEVFDVEIRREGGGVRIECEGETLEARTDTRGALVHVRTDEASHVVEVSEDTRARLDGVDLEYRVDAFRPGEPVTAAGTNGRVPVRAAMQGRLVRVLVQPGQDVAKGEALFIVESMKMQNELQSPAAGRVAEVAAKEGDVVESGRLLAHLEPPSKNG